MGHHSYDGPDPEMEAMLRKIKDEGKQQDFVELKTRLMDAQLNQNIGPTGNHPEGRLTKRDDGGLQFAVAQTGGKVIINFGAPVAWVGMNPEDAEGFAELLLSKAREARKILVKTPGPSTRSKLLGSTT